MSEDQRPLQLPQFVIRSNRPARNANPIDSQDGAAGRIRDRLGISAATRRWIHDRTITGQIRYHKLMGNRYYSSQALYDFIMAQNKISRQHS
jgi:hypothetical protein